MSKYKDRRNSKYEEVREEKIDYSDIPELDTSFWDRANIEYPEPKKPVTLRLDRDILEWFKAHGKGYQTRINAVLRSYMENHKKNAS
ncbi:MAG: BrnA antitoxin family protein [Spirochaetaceae bacterium]|nr:BrnA antitoxin family protein [Spirochaetaceae bacterium]MCF7949442.1 BrnA antitoxin family protein [Spirochaetia bacterium]